MKKYYVYECVDYESRRPFYINIGSGASMLDGSGVEEIEEYKRRSGWRYEILNHFDNEDKAAEYRDRVKKNLINAGYEILN